MNDQLAKCELHIGNEDLRSLNKGRPFTEADITLLNNTACLPTVYDEVACGRNLEKPKPEVLLSPPLGGSLLGCPCIYIKGIFFLLDGI